MSQLRVRFRINQEDEVTISFSEARRIFEKYVYSHSIKYVIVKNEDYNTGIIRITYFCPPEYENEVNAICEAHSESIESLDSPDIHVHLEVSDEQHQADYRRYKASLWETEHILKHLEKHGS